MMQGQNYRASQTVVSVVTCQTSGHVEIRQWMHGLQCGTHTKQVGDAFPSQTVYQHMYVCNNCSKEWLNRLAMPSPSRW